MPVGVSAYVPLANVTLVSSAASITFSGITQIHRDLIIISNQLCTVDAVDGNLQFNGDTGNVSRVFMFGNGSSTQSTYITDRQSFVPKVSAGVLEINIFDYSATDKHKTTLIKSNQAQHITYTQASRWASTAAITSILISPASGSWAAGATFALYGVSA
jgi:hypothetical protein